VQARAAQAAVAVAAGLSWHRAATESWHQPLVLPQPHAPCVLIPGVDSKLTCQE